MNLWSIRDNDPKARSFRNYREEGCVALAAAIIEQAVIDWDTLERGKLKRCIGKSDQGVIKSDEVIEFFQSKWFEYLLSFALPAHTPTEIRKALGIKEPRRKKKKCGRS